MPGKRDHDRRLIAFARQMRKEPTDAEKKLWSIVRREKLGGFRFRRQMPMGGYIADFCCFSARMVLEADGGQHYEPEQQEYDRKRTKTFRDKGFRVLRFSDVDILKHPDAVGRTIYRELTGEQPPP